MKYGGGWILVYVSNTTSVTNNSIIVGSNVNPCILSSNYATNCTQQTWQSTLINASSYMKKNASGEKIIAVFNTSMPWMSLATITPSSTNFKYSYVSNNPSIRYLGYGIDSSSAAGCQDSATLSNINYPFGIGIGNSLCGDSGLRTVFFSNPDPLGVYILGWNNKEGIFVR